LVDSDDDDDDGLMPEWDKPVKPESIAFFERAIQNHSKVRDLRPVRSQSYDIVRHGLDNVRVWVCDVYEVTYADVAAILAEDPKVGAIVTMSIWNHVTAEAHREGVRRGVGVFEFKELMGALTYGGERFVEYIPPESHRRVG
jgi:hypothetical protein